METEVRGATHLNVTVYATSVSALKQALGENIECWEQRTHSIAPHYAVRVQNTRMNLNERLEALTTGLLLRHVLGINNDDQLIFGEFGKPELADGSAYISISHGGDVAAVAVAPIACGPIGLDVERIESYNRPAAQRVLATSEFLRLGHIEDPAEQTRAFCLAWTHLEAVLKATGTGFSRDPRVEGIPSGWRVAHIEHNHHVLALAAADMPTIEMINVTADTLLD